MERVEIHKDLVGKLIRKGFGTKYIRKEGTKGNYKYYYTDPIQEKAYKTGEIKEISDTKTTSDYFFDKKKGWSRERIRKVHTKIYDEYLENAYSSTHPTVVLVMGGTSSGKSTASKGLLGKIKKEEFGGRNIPVLNVDDIREKLPEYQKYSPVVAAANTHSESALLGKNIRDIYIDSKVSFIYDATLSKSWSADKLVKHLKERGYRINLINVTVPIEVAKEREQKRFEHTGRKVPEYILESSHRGGVETFEKIKNLADNYFLIDNNVKLGEKPVLVESNGVVVDEQRKQEFLEKKKWYGVKEAKSGRVRKMAVPVRI